MADAKCDGRTPLLQNRSETETPIPHVNPPQPATYHQDTYQNVPRADCYPYANQGSHVSLPYATNVPQTVANHGQFSLIQPKDYFPLAVFVTFCCCFPLGLVAILMSLQVRNRFKNNDYEGALRASQATRVLSMLAVLFGTILMVGGVAAIISTSIAASANPDHHDDYSYYNDAAK